MATPSSKPAKRKSPKTAMPPLPVLITAAVSFVIFGIFVIFLNQTRSIETEVNTEATQQRRMAERAAQMSEQNHSTLEAQQQAEAEKAAEALHQSKMAEAQAEVEEINRKVRGALIDPSRARMEKLLMIPAKTPWTGVTLLLIHYQSAFSFTNQPPTYLQTS